jgi:hypothetical protein
LILTALIASLLYLLLYRPTRLARSFIHKQQTASQIDLQAFSDKYYDGMNADGAEWEMKIYPRQWKDVIACRQYFSISMSQPDPAKNELSLVGIAYLCASPFGVSEPPDADEFFKREALLP